MQLTCQPWKPPLDSDNESPVEMGINETGQNNQEGSMLVMEAGSPSRKRIRGPNQHDQEVHADAGMHKKSPPSVINENCSMEYQRFGKEKIFSIIFCGRRKLILIFLSLVKLEFVSASVASEILCKLRF